MIARRENGQQCIDWQPRLNFMLQTGSSERASDVKGLGMRGFFWKQKSNLPLQNEMLALVFLIHIFMRNEAKNTVSWLQGLYHFLEQGCIQF